jgi:tetratricopeptide (TPR) repeat protein
MRRTLQEGFKHHQTGQFAKAKKIYLGVLEQSPGDAMAMHYLGVVAHQTGQACEALEWMRKSIVADPNVPDFHCNLGVLLRDLNQLENAVASLCTAIRLRPKYPEALSNLGDVLRMQKRTADAEHVLRQSIAIRSSPAAVNNLALVLIDGKRPSEAIELLQELLESAPDDPTTQRNLGIALRAARRYPEAISLSRRILKKNESDADAWFGLANSLRAVEDLPAAAAAYRRALRREPDHSELLLDLCGTLADLGEIPTAIEAGSRAIALKPDSHEARYNLSIALLKGGYLREGWEFYESRWHCADFVGLLKPLSRPRWNGSSPAGRTILIRAEQGAGDTIHFCRYLPMLVQLGAKVILECQADLIPLLKSLPGVHRIVANGEPAGEYDFHLPMLSLPEIFQTALQTIPARVPYLHTDIRRTAFWAARLAKYPEFKCGLVWAGNPNHRHDRNRSIPLTTFAPLAAQSGIRFFSLQKGVPFDTAFPGLIDLSGDLTDYSETAAALANLDLLVSVDTSCAHLAGALGRPVWTLLPTECDWRWMTETSATPWYPTMRLYRQEQRGDWPEVISQITTELARQIQSHIAA